MSATVRLLTNDFSRGVIAPASETDGYRIFLIKGLTYLLGADGASNDGGTLRDPYATLTFGGKRVAFNDDYDGSDLDPSFKYTARSSGDHILTIGETGANAKGSYEVFASAGIATKKADLVHGAGSDDAIGGWDGNDTIAGFAGKDALFGQDGSDMLRGGSGSDQLDGGRDNDLLRGETSSDTIFGGMGADRLAGGTAADVFVFTSASQSAPTAFDRIIAFDGAPAFEGVGVKGGDVIDLSEIDARPGTFRDEAFTFVQGPLVRGGVQLYENAQGDTILVGSTDSDRDPEFLIRIDDGAIRASDYTAGDFIL